MQNNLSQNAINLILLKLKSVFGAKTDTQLAEYLGIKQNTVSTWKTRGSLDYPIVIAKCDNKNVDLNWLFDENNLDTNFETKCVRNVTLQNSNKEGNKKGNNRNVNETLPFASSDAPPTIIYERDPRDVEMIELQKKHITLMEQQIASMAEQIADLKKELEELSGFVVSGTSYPAASFAATLTDNPKGGDNPRLNRP